MLYPLKFQPILKEKIWGGKRLKIYGKSFADQQSIGESWELSAQGNDVSVVAEGVLSENDLNELVEVYMGDLVGDAVYERYGNQFPLLFKFIDAEDRLSIQVHPDDDTAWERHHDSGKTEMWYVLDADPGATLTLGFARDSSKEDLQQHLADNSLSDILCKIPVRQSDVAFIPAGLVHAVDQGVVLAEIQQTSDLTYRLFDYNRLDAQGCPRELHQEVALDVIRYTKNAQPLVNYQAMSNGAVNLVQCEWFTTNLICFNRTIERDYTLLDSFVVYMCVEGQCALHTEVGDVSLRKGETVLLPAIINDVRLIPSSPEVRLLEVYVVVN
ncbi:MAG: class I mannose-6-phosphate isomerase [Paludibacter sp.]|nr:class I mannose-6-phosphate isomerase [Bacteroidales bacterium]MCM1068790.1 class I mannose-6-phosphate isomerase [Prevotella sp.]MCM1353931.1 class I mannose-6-phosphate isomerase [Bacteroides sp.]MCM1443329.1 class I mannose-6-phosphate isomerase [Muribaculum sp.]MCM1482130.1 class I mannose-6-phosphate isomerase [Paludibacter sp.]